MPKLAPGTYTLRASAHGYAIAPRTITVGEGGLDDVVLDAVWQADPGGVTGRISSFYGQQKNKVSVFLREALGEPADTWFQITHIQIPPDCPEALAWYREMLHWERIKNQFFEAWMDRWEGGVDIAANQLGTFLFSLDKLIGSLASSFGKFPELAGPAFAQAEKSIYQQLNRASSRGDRAGVLKADNALRELWALQTHVKMTVGGGYIKLGTTATEEFIGKYTGGDTLTGLYKSLTGLWNNPSTEGVAKLISNVAKLGDRLQKFFDTLNLLGAAYPNLPFAKGFGPLKDLFATLSDGIRLYKDVTGNISDLTMKEALYDLAAMKRAKAYAAVRNALVDCAFRRGCRPIQPIPMPPPRYFAWSSSGATLGLRARDPNSKDSIGAVPEGFIAPQTAILYTVHFENMPTADLPAQKVVIADQLDAALDWSTLELDEIGFGGTIVDVPAGRQTFHRVVHIEGQTLPVAVSASLDPSTGMLRWTLEAIDPITGGTPEDPLAWFLPPNDAAHRGEGYVTFTVRPQAQLAAGAQITNVAQIIFDDNEAIWTNRVVNTIDRDSPTSRVEALPPRVRPDDLTMRWSGEDVAGGLAGSGVARFDVYVSEDGLGSVQPQDVLLVINWINAHPGLSTPPAPPALGPPYYDVNADELILAQDVLLIINYINAHPADSGEGEASLGLVVRPAGSEALDWSVHLVDPTSILSSQPALEASDSHSGAALPQDHRTACPATRKIADSSTSTARRRERADELWEDWEAWLDPLAEEVQGVPLPGRLGFRHAAEVHPAPFR